ncbi:MAG: hypothetical protein IH629_02600 [Thermoleophilia bacterium]|nr:hypothetical protein [Thermoleophilia bacterium]
MSVDTSACGQGDGAADADAEGEVEGDGRAVFGAEIAGIHDVATSAQRLTSRRHRSRTA